MGVWLYVTSDPNYPFGRGPEVFVKQSDGWVDVNFDLGNPAALGQAHGTTTDTNGVVVFDKTHINQFGMQLETFRCP